MTQDFPSEVRLMYLGDWCCRLCGGNGTECGGLEIHHIIGRKEAHYSKSVLNSSLLCKSCHNTMGHSLEEERKLFAITFKWCYNIGYELSKYDFGFIETNPRLWTEELYLWLDALPLKNKNLPRAKS